MLLVGCSCLDVGIARLADLGFLTVDGHFIHNLDFGSLANGALTTSMVHFAPDPLPLCAFGHILYSLQVQTFYV
jgi:hypothetical protein